MGRSCGRAAHNKSKEEIILGSIAIIIEYGIILAVVSAVAYFVVKKAVKDALDEHEKGRK